jgi:hypothetical protein
VRTTLVARSDEHTLNTRKTAENFPEPPTEASASPDMREVSRLLYALSEPWGRRTPARGLVRKIAGEIQDRPLAEVLAEARASFRSSEVSR